MNAPSVTPPSDELYDKAVAVVTETRRASISTVQRYLMIGYNRASRLMEMMELRGVVSAPMRDGSRVLLDDQSRQTAPTAALSAMSAMSAIDALKPSPQLLCKLGSIIVHAGELLSPNGHEFDHAAMQALLSDPETVGWIAAMRGMALLPEKR